MNELRGNAYRSLVVTSEGKRQLGRPRRTWENNIKIDLGEIGLSIVDWIDLAQDRYRWRAVVNTVTNLWASGCTTGGLSSSAQLHRVRSA
jgi:hypothetical protein